MPMWHGMARHLTALAAAIPLIVVAAILADALARLLDAALTRLAGG